MISPSYRDDFGDIRTGPRLCDVCKKRTGLRYHGETLFCYGCDRASASLGRPAREELIDLAVRAVITPHGAAELAGRG